MDDLDQRRRTVRALELLADSHAAYERGDVAECGALFDRVRREAGSQLALISDGMTAGEIPEPADEAWPEFLARQRYGLDR